MPMHRASHGTKRLAPMLLCRHLEVLKYLYSHGFPQDEDTCSLTALLGHLEAVHYAYGMNNNELRCSEAPDGPWAFGSAKE
jgi:hypothetical protein